MVFKKNDQQRTEALESYGLKVIRFCNKDIDNQFYAVCTVIYDEVNKRI